ncbi:MAG: [LysW]-aminoadipate kinase [Thermoplasmata archaeon]|nr:[LysW]-aminoadipate kinase [Thermoplasmata archaeon]
MIVVKVGGAEGINIQNVIQDLAGYDQFVLVHGCSSLVNKMSQEAGHPPRMVTSVSGYTSRFTDKRTMDIFEKANVKINADIVSSFRELGIDAVGLAGVDGGVLRARRKDAIKIIEDGKKKVLRGDYTGKIESVNVEVLRTLLDAGQLPVVAPIAVSHENEAVNVDGDRAAAAIAGALGAETLIFLSNVPGLMDLENDRPIDRITVDDSMNYAKGRMRKKMLGAKEALESGIRRVILSDANTEMPVTDAMNGAGTVIE